MRARSVPLLAGLFAISSCGLVSRDRESAIESVPFPRDAAVPEGTGATGGVAGFDAGSDVDAPSPISTACAESCGNGSAMVTNECGECLAHAAIGPCQAQYEACLSDEVSGEGCIGCRELTQEACDEEGCPPLTSVCESSRPLANALNACLCAACGDGQPMAEQPGFTSCHRVPPPPSACDDLTLDNCYEAPGCRAILRDFCPENTGCNATPKFHHCAPVAGEAAPGPCESLSEQQCASRPDCSAVHQRDEKNCCPAPLGSTGFVRCRAEPVEPPNAPACQGLNQPQCLALDHCWPMYVSLNGVIACGPYLSGVGECQTCWYPDYVGCI